MSVIIKVGINQQKASVRSYEGRRESCASGARTRMLVPLTAIVTTSLPMAAAIAFCAKDRKTTHAKNKNKSTKSTRSSKSAKGSKSGKSSRSHRSKSQRSKRSSKSGKKGKSLKSSKKGKSGKSGKSSKSKKAVKGAATSSASAASGTSASEKSTRSTKSSRKSSKSSKSRKARRLDSDAQNKMEKSGKSSKIAAACAAAPKVQSTGGTQAAKSLVEEVNAIKHSNQLSVAPAKLQYQTLGGVSQVELKNTSGERKAYKVKCSDNALYRVNPVFGFAEPHSSVKIDVLRLNGEQKTDKLVLLTANAKDSSDPHEAFAKQAEHHEMMVVPLVAS
ncbi:hypothetical protein GCK72_002496 [Caenorhabditis remanei]|nr:hypothetical protein GCK72_002496 [Caenorhabditis remanei]KAF1770675.1 hypothetical protein GCK72_002496 [Caenorhabditis remanei]